MTGSWRMQIGEPSVWWTNSGATYSDNHDTYSTSQKIRFPDGGKLDTMWHFTVAKPNSDHLVVNATTHYFASFQSPDVLNVTTTHVNTVTGDSTVAGIVKIAGVIDVLAHNAG